MTSPQRIEIVVEEPLWRSEGRSWTVQLRRAARLALAASPKTAEGGLTLLLAGDEKLAALNARFRGKDKPTNVLSFPATGGDYLGDVAIAYGATAREAREAGKSIHDHGLHLAVHGVLHLLGYDHESAREARLMESLEIAILAELGIADPYAVRLPRAMAD
jgi:probable rRNA maturation factor